MPTPRQVRRAYLAARDRLLKYENVIGVGFGAVEKGGKLTRELGIIALVTDKLPRSELPEGQLLPKSFQGVPIDVREPRLTQEAHEAFLKENGISLQEGECNLDHFFLSDDKIHRRNLQRLRERNEGPQDEPADPSTAVFGEIFVIEDDGTIVSDGTIDHVAAYDLFRTQFGDDYDFVFFHYDTASGVPGPGNSSPTIHNTISGINHYRGDSYDDRSTWSSTKIQSYQKITGLSQVRRMLHETAHRWCAYVYHQEGGTYSENLHEEFSNAGQAPYHWGTWFDNDDSCMDYDYDDWLDSGTVAGEFEKDSLTAGLPGADEFSYHPVDLYLMGLMSAAEVGTFRYIEDPDDPDGDGSYAGSEVNLTVTNITDEEGARNPPYPDTQRVYHQAFILLTNDMSGIGDLADPATVLGNMELYRAGFLDRFRRATNSRAMIDGSLLHDHFESLYIRDNASDTGGSSSSGAFWNSPDIWVRNADDGGTTHQDTIRDQANYIHARVWNASGSDYDSVRVRFYRANFTGTEFFYPEDFHPDELIGEDVISVPGGGDAIAKATWAAAFIPDETWHPCLLVEVIPMEVSPENRHHVWDNRKLAQKNINIIDPPGDVERVSMAFAFGHPTRAGDKLALLTVARTVDLPGLELFLDPDELELAVERDEGRLPSKVYLPEVRVPGTHPRAPGGLTLTFPRDTEIVLGGDRCAGDEGCVVITLCRGTRIHVRSLEPGERSQGALVPVYRDGRLIYRLPRQPLVGIQVPIAGRGRANMTLHMDLSNVPAQARGGLIQLVQSEEDGKVMGGLEVHIRP
jgi:hypothetical protein